MKKKLSAEHLSHLLDIPSARGMEAVMKARLISAILKAAEKEGLTHVELAKRSGLPRSAVTGILSGSLQKITIDRVLKLVEAAGLVAEVRVHRKSA
jgi:predicted XRE-type DNA-binding protein